MISPLLIMLLTYLHGGDLLQTSPAIVTVNVNECEVYIGASTMIEIIVNVKEGYHIQANTVNDESLVPTTLAVEHNEFIQVEKVFPPSKPFKLDGTDNSLNVYDGKFLIKLFLSPVAKTERGKYVLRSKLRYQACDSKSCLFPRNVDFSIPIEIKGKD